MSEKLTWKAARIAIETEFNQGKYANDEVRKKKKKQRVWDNPGFWMGRSSHEGPAGCAQAVPASLITQ